MWKTIKFLAALIVAVALFTGTAGIASADEGQNSNRGPNGFWETLAQAFNTTAENAKNLFMKARDNNPPPPPGDNVTPQRPPMGENREEMTLEKVEALLSDGTLTQEQADAYKAWLALRPDGPFVDKNRMDNLLANGEITQAQYDAWKAWHEAKPDVQLPGGGPGKNEKPRGDNPPPPTSDNVTPQRPPTGENREEMTLEKVETLLADGTLTQEQADAYEAWLGQRPDGPFVDRDRMESLLKDGKITQAQYDAWKAWHAAKPDVQLPGGGPGKNEKPRGNNPPPPNPKGPGGKR